LKYDLKDSSIRNVMKQNQLPSYNGRQWQRLKRQRGIRREVSSEDVDFLDAQDHDGRCAGQQILYREECERTFLQVIGMMGFNSSAPRLTRLA